MLYQMVNVLAKDMVGIYMLYQMVIVLVKSRVGICRIKWYWLRERYILYQMINVLAKRKVYPVSNG